MKIRLVKGFTLNGTPMVIAKIPGGIRVLYRLDQLIKKA
jgi:hypothetical protein